MPDLHLNEKRRFCIQNSERDRCRQVNGVYRELGRNKGKRGYRFRQAHRLATQRRTLASRKNTKINVDTPQLISEKLGIQWSPKQISGWMRKKKSLFISHETIYRYVWDNKRKGGNLYKNLRHSGKKYNKRSSGKAGRGCIKNRIDIKERPEVVNTKERLGDWEVDCIVGKGQYKAIVSIVERKSKYTKLALVERRSSENVSQAIENKLLPIKDFVWSITADNGKEFANHEQVSQSLCAGFFFATPYHSWERGLHEHTNGLVRQYFPKGTSFGDIQEDHLELVELLLNNRPRKVLEFRTPMEVFNQEISGAPFVALQC